MSLCRFKRRLSLCDLLPSKGTNNVGDFSAIVFFPLYSVIRIALTAGSGMKSLFTGIDFSNHKEVSFDDECLFLSCSFIFCYCLFVVVFFESIAWNLFLQIRYSVSVSFSVIPFPDFGFQVLVLPVINILHLGNGSKCHQLIGNYR